jgi:2-oxoglutarate ferredoxin oxidoreductase subunit beta
MRLARDCEEAFAEAESTEVETSEESWGHPVEEALRRDRLPHIWCPGCGIGTAMGAFVEALGDAGVSRDRLAVVSGIGCSGRVSGYTDCDSFHTTHGRAIPFALGLHLANPSLEVVVFSGDGDLAAIGGNHLFHAARRNADITVLCVNNFNYGMTGGQHGPTSHPGARTATTPYGNIEPAFNLPHVVAAAGATYVARWTVLDLGRLRRSIAEALQHKGFAFVEILSPCPIYYGRFNRRADPLDELRSYRERTEVRNFAPLEDCALSLDGRIVVGKFVERQAPTLAELVLGELPRRAQPTAGR